MPFRRFLMPRAAIQLLSEGEWGFGPLQARATRPGRPSISWRRLLVAVTLRGRGRAAG